MGRGRRSLSRAVARGGAGHRDCRISVRGCLFDQSAEQRIERFGLPRREVLAERGLDRRRVDRPHPRPHRPAGGGDRDDLPAAVLGMGAALDIARAFEPVDQAGEIVTRLEDRLEAPPYFDGGAFSLVDAAFGPVFRYFDVFDRIGDFGVLTGKPKVASWREALAARPSVRAAVTPGYDARLSAFLQARKSHLSRLMA